MFKKTCMRNISISRRFSFFNRSFVAFTVLAGLLLIFAMCHKSSSTGPSKISKVWIGTWSTAPQLVEPSNMPPSPGLSNNTLRQIVCVSLGGDSLRVRFSNEFGTSPVTMNSVHIAVSAGGSLISQKQTYHYLSLVTLVSPLNLALRSHQILSISK